jgi:hypothetical protein
VFLTAREEEPEEEKEKNAKISLLPFSVSSSLLCTTNVSSQSNNLHNFGDHNIA